MITAIIVDDEQKNITMLVGLLHEYCPQVALVGTANEAATARQLVLDLRPQLLFIDIEMPYGSGFDLLESLPGLDAEVVFITAFNKYALDAFRFSAIDYLLKPVNIEELEEAVGRAEQRIKEKTTTRNYELLLRNMAAKDASMQTVALADKGQQHLVPLADIMYIIADGSYSHVHTAGRTFVSTRNLKDFETMLPATLFYRIHNGHLVNKAHIARVQRGRGGIVLMKDGRELEVAVRRKEDFLRMIRG